MFGGEMIDEVSSKKTTLASVPHRLEAGTPHIAGVIGLRAAVEYLEKIGFEEIAKHEKILAMQLRRKLHSAFDKNITLYGPEDHAGIVTFNFKDHHAHDVAAILDQEKNVAIRAGHHCVMPLHTEFLKVPATCRASFYLYNDETDVDNIIEGLKIVDTIFKK